MSAGGSHLASGFFALRTPLLPLTEWLHLGEGLETPGLTGAPAERVEAALEQDRQTLRARLRALLERPEIRDALFVASPDLEGSLPLWLENPAGERGQKVERALVRYVARMTSRPTPFGLFAGCSVGTMAEQTRLVLPGRETYQRHTRLHMDYLFALAEALGKEPALRASLKYRPSSSLYRAAGRLRYAQARLNGKLRSHHLVAVEPSDYLVETLSRAQAGATVAELAGPLVTDEITQAEAEEFIGQLIETQLLESDLPPAVTGEEPIHGMISLLREQPSGRAVAEGLDGARRALAELDAAGLGVTPSRYRDVARGLEQLPAKVELPRLFQVDMVKPAPGVTLGRDVVAELWRGVEVLHRLVATGDEALERFREAFVKRYEAREVPLMEALDEEAGIGFQTSTAPGTEAAPLLDGLRWPGEPEKIPGLRPQAASLLLSKVDAAVRAGQLEVELLPEDLEALAQERVPPLPDALAAVAILLGTPEEVARGDYKLLLNGVAGPPGTRMLGRFCHADPELHRHVQALVRAEEALHPDAVYAEIVHLPEGRVGNVLCRPVLREYELPYLGHSGAPPERRLPLTDLRIRVVGGRIVLRSARLGREVIPRLSTAHNFVHDSLGAYRFLCTLQGQGVAQPFAWRWGTLERAPFLPGVRVGKLLLTAPRWRLEKAELEKLGALRGAALLEAVRALRARLSLPRHASLAQSDNVLPLDLENVLSLETFVQLVKGQEAAILEEASTPRELAATGPEGPFTHELVIPFVRRPAEPARRSPAPLPAVTRQRSFPPGSPWLYAKLYAGNASADLMLREHLPELVRQALGSGAAERWFFIRYADPEPHLRLRFLGAPARLHAEVLPALGTLAEALMREGLLQRLQLDTYEREVERYGGEDGILLAEQLFHHDSETVLALVGMLSGDEGADARWRLALRGCDLLLADLGMDLPARLRVLRPMREGLAREHRADKLFEEQLSARFRKERKALEALVFEPEEGHPLAPGLEVLRRRSAALAPVVEQLRASERDGRLTVPIEGLAGSYIHMHVNRLLRSAQRAQELVLYDFLARLYESHLARARKAGAERTP